VHPSDGRRLKINRIDDQPKKRYADHRWVDHEEEEDQGMSGRTVVPTYRMDLPGPTTSVGTRTDYSVGPWDYPACATRHLMAWGARTTVEKYSDRKLYIPCTV
jgi:hypothetical protein